MFIPYNLKKTISKSLIFFQNAILSEKKFLVYFAVVGMEPMLESTLPLCSPQPPNTFLNGYLVSQ
jgi:hypothetical protein